MAVAEERWREKNGEEEREGAEHGCAANERAEGRGTERRECEKTGEEGKEGGEEGKEREVRCDGREGWGRKMDQRTAAALVFPLGVEGGTHLLCACAKAATVVVGLGEFDHQTGQTAMPYAYETTGTYVRSTMAQRACWHPKSTVCYNELTGLP